MPTPTGLSFDRVGKIAHTPSPNAGAQQAILPTLQEADYAVASAIVWDSAAQPIRPGSSQVMSKVGISASNVS